ncbi:MAG: hypothetical protein ACOC0F_01420 [archaeon]
MATTHERETVKQGIDVEQLHEFVEHATENPEDVQFELGARALYEGRLFHSLAKMDAYTFGDDEIKRETREYTLPMVRGRRPRLREGSSIPRTAWSRSRWPSPRFPAA